MDFFFPNVNSTNFIYLFVKICQNFEILKKEKKKETLVLVHTKAAVKWEVSKWENGVVRLWVPGHTSHIDQWEVSTNGLESLLSIVSCVNGDFSELSNRVGF